MLTVAIMTSMDKSYICIDRMRSLYVHKSNNTMEVRDAAN